MIFKSDGFGKLKHKLSPNRRLRERGVYCNPEAHFQSYYYLAPTIPSGERPTLVGSFICSIFHSHRPGSNLGFGQLAVNVDYHTY